MTYCFVCTEGHPYESWAREPLPECLECGAPVHRNYRAEGVGIGSGVRVSRTGTNRDQAEVFLPTNREFKGPGDPDGTKGMRAWHDRFSPRADNPRPVKVGEIDKRVF